MPTDPPAGGDRRLRLARRPRPARILPRLKHTCDTRQRRRTFLRIQRACAVTSSAGLDEDDLGFVLQRFALLCVQVFVDVVDVEQVRFVGVGLPVDAAHGPQYSMRHDDHKHAVCVFELWVGRELPYGGVDFLRANDATFDIARTGDTRVLTGVLLPSL